MPAKSPRTPLWCQIRRTIDTIPVPLVSCVHCCRIRMVSSGCPMTTLQAPPMPPAMNSRMKSDIMACRLPRHFRSCLRLVSSGPPPANCKRSQISLENARIGSRHGGLRPRLCRGFPRRHGGPGDSLLEQRIRSGGFHTAALRPWCDARGLRGLAQARPASTRLTGGYSHPWRCVRGALPRSRPGARSRHAAR